MQQLIFLQLFQLQHLVLLFLSFMFVARIIIYRSLDITSSKSNFFSTLLGSFTLYKTEDTLVARDSGSAFTTFSFKYFSCTFGLISLHQYLFFPNFQLSHTNATELEMYRISMELIFLNFPIRTS